VTPISDTSYYAIGITGPDVPVIVALANAYAEEIVALLREENLGSVRGQVESVEKEWQDRRDVCRDRVAALRGDLAAIQEANPGVDGVRRVNQALLYLDPMRRILFEARDGCEIRAEALRGAVAVLGAEGLALGSVAGEGRTAFSVVPAAAGGNLDGLLAPDVQALPCVGADENVRRTRDQLRAQQDLDRALSSGALTLREGAPERQAARRRIAELDAALAGETAAAVCTLARSLEEDRARVARLESRVKDLDGTAREGAVALARMEEVDRRIEDARKEMDSFDARLAEAARLRKTVIEAGVTAQDLLRKIQDARASAAAKVSPDLLRISALTALAAILLLVGLVHLLQTLDDTVKCREDFDRLVRGLPLLGVVPGIPGTPEGEFRIEALRGETGTPVVESFRALRTTLQHNGAGKAAMVLLVTSSAPREGKTTLTSNLAASFARGGGRTLLVDGDLRRPRVHQATGGPNAVGLSTVLTGKATLAEAVRPSPEEPNLFVLPAGPIPSNPAELLGSRRMEEVLAEARRTYDRVLIDSPPVASVTDPCILARHADAVVLVIAHARTSIQLIRRARESLDAVGVKPWGAVINNASPGRGFYGESYYGYAYRGCTYGEMVN
jgi:capsular exopolysaccharide synthesis family protein